jgi:hypothetical protein
MKGKQPNAHGLVWDEDIEEWITPEKQAELNKEADELVELEDKHPDLSMMEVIRLHQQLKKN